MMRFKYEPKVGFTSNQAANLFFSIVEKSIKKIINMDLGGTLTLEGLFWVRVPKISLAGSMRAQGGPPVHIIVPGYPKSCPIIGPCMVH